MPPLMRPLLLLALLLSACPMPGESLTGRLPEASPEEARLARELGGHVAAITRLGARNVWAPEALRESVAYIEGQLRETGYAVERQTYEVRGVEVVNLIATLPGRVDEAIVVGAHYDTVMGTVGADDNASGVAALLSLARLLREVELERTVRFVFFVNEEPPFFQTEQMGSRVYAARCREREEAIAAMISFDGIGYFRDEPGSQNYPFPLGLSYPSEGNFIGVVGNLGSRALVDRVVGLFREHATIPSEAVALPGWMPGVGWSDHWSFWQHGYEAVMVTDTLPFRNPHYHEPSDTPDQLDYGRMARVVAGIRSVVVELANGE